MVQTRMVQTRNKLKFDELDKLKELISERGSNKKLKIKQKQETENKRKLRLVKNKTLKGRRVCVEKKQVNDKSNKDYWISC